MGGGSPNGNKQDACDLDKSRTSQFAMLLLSGEKFCEHP